MLRHRISALAVLAVAGLAVSGPSPAASDPSSADCAPGSEAQLNVAVTGVRSADGNVTITVYGDDPDDFLASGGKLFRHRVPAEAGETRKCMELPGPGTYAIAVYHDEDDDHDWDRNLIGLPTEGYGVSNNPKLGFMPPDFDEVKFEAGEGETEVAITMNY